MVFAKNSSGRLRWIDYARRSMQRVGFVKWVLSLTSVSQTQTLESITRTFAATVTKQVLVDAKYSDAFEQYVRRQQLHRRYSGDAKSAELQDLFLSDPSLPSHSGAVTGDFQRTGYRHAVYVEIPTWAARLRMLRQQNYTLTERGRVLLLVGSGLPVRPLGLDGSNPLCLNLAERYVSLFSLLDADGDLLAAMYRRLLSQVTFSRSTAGEVAADALEELREKRLKNASVGLLQEARVKVDRAIAAIRKRSVGGLGPKESIATPRTEPLVDCGILHKSDPDKYEYSFTNWGRTFLTGLASVPSIDEFLSSHLSSAMSPLTGQQLNAEAPPLRVVERPYEQLRTGLGYVSLRELSVASIALSLSFPLAPLFEIDAIENAVRKAASKGDRYVRLAIGRAGGIAQVRVDHRAFSQ